MPSTTKFIATLALGVLTAGGVIAASHSASPVDPKSAVTARKGHMQIYAHNLGILGGMARGSIEYDAALATTAADNLAAAAAMSQDTYWVPGTAVDEYEGSKALPVIWEDMAGFEEDMMALTEASAALAGTAGDGVEAIQAGMRGIGGACGACHEDYRQSDN